MPPSFLSLPAEVRLHVYGYFIPPSMEVDDAGDHLSAQRLRATCHQICREIDLELLRRIRLAVKSRISDEGYKIKMSNVASKLKVKFIIPASLLRAAAQAAPNHTNTPDPRTSLSYRLLGATPSYVKDIYFRIHHDITSSPLEAHRYASHVIAGRVYYELDNR